jgi:hypothetical protein
MKKRKFDSGGMTRIYEEQMRKAMPNKYESVRPRGFESDVQNEKDAAIGQGVRAAGKLAKSGAISTVPGGAVVADFNTPAKELRSAVRNYKAASAMEDAADRELDSQIKRETRGMKAGGTASSRADGIAQRGKTRGKLC